MSEAKKYYWIKLKDSMFTSDSVDFLMSQKDGAKYIVLYQMLCLETIKTNGELVRTIGEIIIPYDVDKIQRDCKYFDRDTIVVALGLYQKLGLVYMQSNGYLKIANYENMIGSEVSSAQRVREFRQREREIQSLQCNTLCNADVTQDIDIDIDKEKENRYINISPKESATKVAREVFKKPLLEDVIAYCNERQNNIDAEAFISFYESKGWMIGKNKMKDWKACIRTWEQKRRVENTHTRDFSERQYTKKEMDSVLSSIDEFNPDEL